MDLADMKTVLFFYIAELGTTPNINNYIAAAKGNDPRATGRAWNALSEPEQAIVLEAYSRLQQESTA